MPRDLDLDFEFQDDEIRERPSRPARPAPRRDGAGRGGARGGAPARRRKNDTTSIIILGVEIVVFIALIILFFVLKGKIVDSDSSSSSSSAEASESSGGTSDGVNVESDDFSLTCTKVQLVMDANDNTAAVVYFTFVNKTDTPLAMSEVFPASVKQNGADCPEDMDLTDIPAEIGNKDMQISGGQSAECAYAFQLSDQTSPLTLTIRDNYSTFQDIGSTEIPIS